LSTGTVSVQKTDGSTLLLDEQYVTKQGSATQTYEVPADNYFVMGDNRPESSDSRTWGFVPKENIVGRAFLRLLPIQKITLFPGSVAEQQ
jgi:signal peptidase I